ncbi:MAG TPA: YdcF family protein [Polyangia bacterium]|nr:YdcF family protein [Polyangia bacterium]
MLGWFVRALCRPLAPRVALERADAIVVLGAPVGPGGAIGAALEERVRAGVALWQRGLGQWLIVSGGAALAGLMPEAPAMAARARELGVPADAVWVEDQSRSTRENAERSAALLRARGLGSAIVVTQPYHLRRAIAFFTRQGISAQPYFMADSCIFEGGATSARSLRWVVREYLLLLHYRLRGEL